MAFLGPPLIKLAHWSVINEWLWPCFKLVETSIKLTEDKFLFLRKIDLRWLLLYFFELPRKTSTLRARIVLWTLTSV